MKKTWETPKLIVVVRGQPGESLLTVCKECPMLNPTGPSNLYDGCESSIPEVCPRCADYDLS
jgi:hypothetical protein